MKIWFKRCLMILAVLLILGLGTTTGLFVYKIYFEKTVDDLSGTWLGTLSLTDQVAASMFSWLSDVEEVDITYDEIREEIGDLNLTITLSMDQKDGMKNEGQFHQDLSEEEYERLSESVNETFCLLFQKMIFNRLCRAGYTEEFDASVVDNLMYETLGMSTSKYLEDYGPVLLPEYETLKTEYEIYGIYQVLDSGLFCRVTDVSGETLEKTIVYAFDDSVLVLNEENDLSSNALVFIRVMELQEMQSK